MKQWVPYFLPCPSEPVIWWVICKQRGFVGSVHNNQYTSSIHWIVGCNKNAHITCILPLRPRGHRRHSSPHSRCMLEQWLSGQWMRRGSPNMWLTEEKGIQTFAQTPLKLENYMDFVDVGRWYGAPFSDTGIFLKQSKHRFLQYSMQVQCTQSLSHTAGQSHQSTGK